MLPGPSSRSTKGCDHTDDTTQGFLCTLGEHRLITPLPSADGHRRYARYQLRIAARAREIADQGTLTEAACRIVILQDQLEEARRINTAYRAAAESANPTAAA